MNCNIKYPVINDINGITMDELNDINSALNNISKLFFIDNVEIYMSYDTDGCLYLTINSDKIINFMFDSWYGILSENYIGIYEKDILYTFDNMISIFNVLTIQSYMFNEHIDCKNTMGLVSEDNQRLINKDGEKINCYDIINPKNHKGIFVDNYNFVVDKIL